MKKGEIYEGRVQEVLFPDKAIVVTMKGNCTGKIWHPRSKITFSCKEKEKRKNRRHFA